MRIAIFQDTYHPKVDGVVVSTDLFTKELRKRGHEVMLIVPRHPKGSYEAAEDVFLVDSVATDWIYPGTCLGKFWKSNLAELFAARPPDLIHSMTELTVGYWVAEYWRQKLRVPRLHTFHTLWTEYLFYVPFLPEWFSQRLVRYLAPRSSRKRMDHIIAPSEAMRTALREDWGIKAQPINVVPTGIDLTQFDRMNGEAFRAKHGIAADESVVLYLGRLGPEKNAELVVNTMAALRRRGEKKLRFVIAGGGPTEYLDKLHRLAAEHGLNDVIWTGFIKGQEWLDCYGAADLMLFPSVTETQGLVVIEALAAGIPLVSVEAMGPASTMKGERGCLFAANDPEVFADAAQRLLHDEVLYERKRREALEVARSYSIEQRTNELEAIYANALGMAIPEAAPLPLRAVVG